MQHANELRSTFGQACCQEDLRSGRMEGSTLTGWYHCCAALQGGTSQHEKGSAMASSNRRSSQKRTGEAKQAESVPLMFSPDPDKRQALEHEEDVYVDDDQIAPDPPRSPTSAIRYQPPEPAPSQRRGERRDTRADRDTTRQPAPETQGAPIAPRRAGQASDASPGPVPLRAGRGTGTGAVLLPPPVS